jgi:hypothetical protein
MAIKKLQNLKLILFLLCLSLTLNSFHPKSKKTNNELELLARANLMNLQFPGEKIYLHLDRPSYFVGEDIWYNAYLLNSPIPNCNIYIELLNSTGEIIDKKINWAQNGLAYGDFHLDNTLTSGMYQIRAYTNWMRNFESNWFFRKNIIIWNRRDKNMTPDVTELKSKEIDLQFFPEGGSILSNAKNRIAFKATDKNGKGISVEGEIVDDKGNKIVEYESSFQGMGSFVFEPEHGTKYKAKATVAGEHVVNVELPEHRKDIIKLTINPNKPDKIEIKVSNGIFGQDNVTESKYFLIGQSNGQVCYRNEIVANEINTRLEIEKKSLPTGILKFTLFDNSFIPHCERLVFVNNHDYVNVGIIAENAIYRTRENVQFDIKTMSKKGVPLPANLSISVSNQESSIETEDYANNILTQFLLKSELKGTIENPAWYFKDDSLTTLQALDNLMLTHGYRYFEWEEIMEGKSPEIKYQPEESVQLKGTVSNWLTKKPVKDCKVTMMSVKSLLAIYDVNTDSLGNFVFTDLFFNDTVFVSLQAGDKNERRKYWIELDDRSLVSPKSEYLPVSYRYKNKNQYTTSWYLSEIENDIKNRKWHLNDTILLGDVNIVSSEIEKGDGHARPYLDADYVLDVSKQDPIYTDVFEMMENISPYMRNYMKQNPVYFLDGVLVDPEFIIDLPTSWFDKIEAVKLAPKSGGFGPALYFYTNRGETQTKDFDGLGLKAGKIVGYSVIRRFYSPVYETREPDDSKNDFRNTLYWNPVVRTDSTGVAKVSFYNSDETGTIKVFVEGITNEGKLCRGTATYEVSN